MTGWNRSRLSTGRGTLLVGKTSMKNETRRAGRWRVPDRRIAWVAASSFLALLGNTSADEARCVPRHEEELSSPEAPVGVVTDLETLMRAAEGTRRRAAAAGLLARSAATLVARSAAGLPVDPLFPSQWHLVNTGQDPCAGFGFSCFNAIAGLDIDVANVWPDYTGEGIVVALREWGTEVTHDDLSDRYDAAHGDGPGDPTQYSHGTAVAGVVAAREGNGAGGVGVAFGAVFTRIGFLNPGDGPIEAVATWADVVTRSGGGFWTADQEYLATHGRGGLGTVNVKSAGNLRSINFHLNMAAEKASRFGMAVASVGPFGLVSSDSSSGSTVFLSAPGEYVITPVPQGSGINGGDYGMFFGTSAAAPIVASVAALVLEANPGLGWRDVQQILAASAAPIDWDNSSSWIANGARDWNGGGFFTSPDYGFGLVDARAAVRLAETWQRLSTGSTEVTRSATTVVERPIPDGDTIVETIEIASADDLVVEFVEIHLTLTPRLGRVFGSPEPFVSDLRLRLRSPDGTESVLMTPLTDLNQDSGVIMEASQPMGSVASWGERGAGLWELTIEDTGADGVTAMLNDWTLALHGHPVGEDDLFLLTDAYSRFTTPANAARRILNDDGGTDTLQAAAVSTSMLVDLRPGATSTIAGNELQIASETWIENVVTGDGDDVIVGNALDNVVRPGRGDDVVDGGPGFDTVVLSGARADYLTRCDQLIDLAPEQQGNDGIDGIASIERVRFRDGDVVFDFSDSDGDGAVECADNCPAVANTNQANGDGDALGDACDACPFDAANDVDADGVCGNVDNCPAVANANQANADGDLLGDACDVCPLDALNNADADTVCGDVDNCPAVANTNQTDTDGDFFGDACDNCIDVFNPAQFDACSEAALCFSANMDTTSFSTNRVDGRDLAVLAGAWNSCPTGPGSERYDATANLDAIPVEPGACVDAADFHLFMTSFGRTCL